MPGLSIADVPLHLAHDNRAPIGFLGEEPQNQQGGSEGYKDPDEDDIIVEEEERGDLNDEEDA